MDKVFHSTLYRAHDTSSILGWNIIHVIKRAPGRLVHMRCHPTPAHEFQGFKGEENPYFERCNSIANLANKVKVGHAFDQSCSVQSHGQRVHQNNEQLRRSSRTNRETEGRCDFLKRIKWLYLLFKWNENKNPLWMVSLTLNFALSFEIMTHTAVAKCELIWWRSVSKKPCAWVFIIWLP